MGEDRGKLVEAHMALVEAIASSVHRRVRPHVEFQELVSLGTAGLLEAIDRYDPDRGITLATFAHYRIRGSIFDGLRVMGNLPRRAYRQATIARHTDDYLESCGRRAAGARQPGRPAAPADTLSTTRALAQGIRSVMAIHVAARAGSTALAMSGVTPGRGETEFAAMADPRVVPSDEQVLHKQRLARLRVALGQLPEREQLVIRRCYFEGQALVAVAQELGLSSSWTSRLHARAVERLRDLLDDDRDESPTRR